MQGKYSPTVNWAYYRNQQWFKLAPDSAVYDLQGYDQYGYNADGYDRAGHKEYEYYDEESPLFDQVRKMDQP